MSRHFGLDLKQFGRQCFCSFFFSAVAALLFCAATSDAPSERIMARLHYPER